MTRICMLTTPLLLLWTALMTVAQDDAPIPLFRPLRRMTRNFYPGRRARLTLVYQSSEEFTHRWFRASDANLPWAEVPNMLPIRDNDPNYIRSSLHSGTVHAINMDIIGLQEPLPVKYVTIFSAVNRSMQYHVISEIDKRIQLDSSSEFGNTSYDRPEVEHLDGVLWEVAPPTFKSYRQGDDFILQCVADLESYSSSTFTDKLDLVHTSWGGRKNDPTSDIGFLRQRSLGVVHTLQDTDHFEEDDHTWQSSTKVDLQNGIHRFNLTVKVRNASPNDTGMFTCMVERESDRTYISSFFTQPSIYDKPHLELRPCDGTDIEKSRKSFDRLTIRKKKPTCFRCLSFGHMDTKLHFSKEGRILHNTQNIHVDLHHNSEQGGLLERTLIIWSPSRRDAGNYTCNAVYEGHVTTLPFKLKFRS